MLATGLEPAFEGEPLSCSNQMQAVMSCAEEGCGSYSLICANEECECQVPHAKHVQIKVRWLTEKVKEPAKCLLQLRDAEKLLEGCLDSMAAAIEHCKQKHKSLLGLQIEKHYPLVILKQKLEAKSQVGREQLTGSAVTNMIKDIDGKTKKQLPYIDNLTQLTQETADLKNQLKKLLASFEKLWNFDRKAVIPSSKI